MSKKLTLSKNIKVRPDIVDYFRGIIPQLNPNWTNVSDDDIGMVIVQIIAGLADTNNFRIDMNHLEHYLSTANERSNVQGLLNLIGYQLSTYKTSYVDIVIKRVIDSDTGIIDNASKITIPQYSTFTTDDGDIVYSNLSEIVIPKGINEIAVRLYEGLYAVERYDSTDIDTSGRFFLSNKIIPENAITVKYNGEPLTYSDDVFLAEDSMRFQLMTDKYSNNYIQLDASWKDYVNTLSAEPVVIEYLQTSLGSGAVGPNSITRLETLGPTDRNEYNVDIINAKESRGWSYPESIEQARIDAPKYARTMKSAVTLQDYEDLIELNDDFYDAKVLDLNYKESGVTEPYQLKVVVVNNERTKLTDDNMKVLHKIIDNRRLTTMKYTIIDPEEVPIDVNLTLYINPTSINHQILIDSATDLVKNQFYNYRVGDGFYISKIIANVHTNLGYDCLSYVGFKNTVEKKEVNKVQRLVLGKLTITVEEV